MANETCPRRLTFSVAKLIATALGAGYSPVAPGTAGTALAVPLAWGLAHLGGTSYVLGMLAVTGIGIWAADVAEDAFGEHDCQKIVIDEVAGYLVTMVAVPCTAVNLVLGFALFRLFDIWKPPPVRQIDERTPGGLGVMADDLAAGVYGAVVLYAIDRLEVVRLIAGYFWQ